MLLFTCLCVCAREHAHACMSMSVCVCLCVMHILDKAQLLGVISLLSPCLGSDDRTQLFRLP